MRQLCLIGCVKEKQQTKSKAKDLYVSTLFKYSLQYAQKNFDKVVILSAKHGVLELDEEIEPYELTLNNMKSDDIKRWSYYVEKQLEEKYPHEEWEYNIIAGEKYYKYLHIKKTIHFRLSIGHKLHALKERCKE